MVAWFFYSTLCCLISSIPVVGGAILIFENFSVPLSLLGGILILIGLIWYCASLCCLVPLVRLGFEYWFGSFLLVVKQQKNL